jgi:hypothetical protein
VIASAWDRSRRRGKGHGSRLIGFTRNNRLVRAWCARGPNQLEVTRMVARTRTAVVFPAPFGPRSPNTVPGRTVKSIPESPTTSPKRFCSPSTSMAWPSLKHPSVARIPRPLGKHRAGESENVGRCVGNQLIESVATRLRCEQLTVGSVQSRSVALAQPAESAASAIAHASGSPLGSKRQGLARRGLTEATGSSLSPPKRHPCSS